MARLDIADAVRAPLGASSSVNRDLGAKWRPLCSRSQRVIQEGQGYRPRWWPVLWFNCWTMYFLLRSWVSQSGLKKIPQGNSLLVFWKLFLCIKAWHTKLEPLVWFYGTLCFHPACNPEVKNKCANSPDAAMMGKGWDGCLMMNQVLQTKQGVFCSWMSHSDEIPSTAHSPFLDGPSDNLIKNLRRSLELFVGKILVSWHICCLLQPSPVLGWAINTLTRQST